MTGASNWSTIVEENCGSYLFFDKKIKKYTTPNFIFISTSDSPVWTKKYVSQEIEKRGLTHGG